MGRPVLVADQLGGLLPFVLAQWLISPTEIQLRGEPLQPTIDQLLGGNRGPSEFDQAVQFGRGGGTPEQDASMLQNGSLGSPLGTAGYLGGADQHIAGRTSLKAEKGVGLLPRVGGWPAEFRLNAQTSQCGDERIVDRIVKELSSLGQFVSGGQDEAVGQFVLMKNGPATGCPPYHRTLDTGVMPRSVVQVLEIPQRERRLLPAIEPPTTLAGDGSPFQKDFVHGHVPGAGGGRVDN